MVYKKRQIVIVCVRMHSSKIIILTQMNEACMQQQNKQFGYVILDKSVDTLKLLIFFAKKYYFFKFCR